MSLLRKSPPEPPAPEQGAEPVTTITLRNPAARIAEWETEAAQSMAAFEQDAKSANQLRLEAEKHARQESAAAAEEMRLSTELSQKRDERQKHAQAKDEKLKQAQQYAERAKHFEDRAADLRTTIATLRQTQQNGNGQPLDPTAETRMDQSLARIDAAHAELADKHRDEGDL